MDPELHEIIQNLGAEPERHPRKARRTRALGWFVWILLAVGIASFISPWLGLPGWFVGLLSLGAASVLKRFQTRAKRMVSIGAATKLQQDPRPPVVYLRSFAKDAHSSSFEERLLRELDVVGPVIAIGRPGETLPPLGAYRLYPKPDQWREAVVRLMQLSGAVVLRGGKTEGVLWETARAREYVPPERLLIMLPGTNPEEPGYAHSEKEPARLEERYREFRELVQGNFPKGLPERSDGAGFVCFDVDWNPRLIGRTRTETRERPRRGGVCPRRLQFRRGVGLRLRRRLFEGGRGLEIASRLATGSPLQDIRVATG